MKGVTPSTLLSFLLPPAHRCGQQRTRIARPGGVTSLQKRMASSRQSGHTRMRSLYRAPACPPISCHSLLSTPSVRPRSLTPTALNPRPFPPCSPALIHAHVHPFLATLRPLTLADVHTQYLDPFPLPAVLPFLSHSLSSVFVQPCSRPTQLADQTKSENPNKEGVGKTLLCACSICQPAHRTVKAAFDEIGEDDGVWRHHRSPLFEKADCFFHLRALETTPDCTMECQELQMLLKYEQCSSNESLESLKFQIC